MLVDMDIFIRVFVKSSKHPKSINMDGFPHGGALVIATPFLFSYLSPLRFSTIRWLGDLQRVEEEFKEKKTFE